MFPNNATTFFDYLEGNESGSLGGGTLLGFKKNIDVNLFCDSFDPSTINDDDKQVFLHKECNSISYINNSDEGYKFLMVIYTPKDASSTVVSVYNGFSYGEIIATLFLFLILMTLCFTFIWNFAHGIKIAKIK